MIHIHTNVCILKNIKIIEIKNLILQWSTISELSIQWIGIKRKEKQNELKKQ